MPDIDAGSVVYTHEQCVRQCLISIWTVLCIHEQCVWQCLISIRTVLCIDMSSVCSNAWYRYRQCYYRADSAKVWLSSVEKPDPPTKLNLAHKREDWVKNPKSTGAGALSQTVIHFNYMLIGLLYGYRDNKHPMNIGTHFDYNNHIVFISTHTKISTHMKKAPQTEVNLLIRLFQMCVCFSSTV